jgi:hypothetical protein
MSSTTPFLANLDTTFVNLWSLLRKLTEQNFIGRVHVELTDYAVDIFLDGSATPLVREVDRAANTDVTEAGALHRVVLRARETPGTINVFAGADEAVAPQATTTAAPPVAEEKPLLAEVKPSAEDAPVKLTTESDFGWPGSTEHQKIDRHAPPLDEAVYRTGSYDDWPAALSVAAQVIGAVEHGVNAGGADFHSLFETVRLELADDYVFLDPMSQSFRYRGGVASLDNPPSMSAFVAGLSEALRRIVDRVAVGDRARRVRERIALELLPVARKQGEVLERSGLKMQLDRIAGTKVI